VIARATSGDEQGVTNAIGFVPIGLFATWPFLLPLPEEAAARRYLLVSLLVSHVSVSHVFVNLGRNRFFSRGAAMCDSLGRESQVDVSWTAPLWNGFVVKRRPS
jgi:hypothetical protein